MVTAEHPLLITIVTGLNEFASLDEAKDVTPFDLDAYPCCTGDILCRFDWRNVRRSLRLGFDRQCTKLRLPFKPDTDNPNLCLKFFDTRSKIKVKLRRSKADGGTVNQWFHLVDGAGRIGVRISSGFVPQSPPSPTPFPKISEAADTGGVVEPGMDDYTAGLPHHPNLINGDNRTEILARHRETEHHEATRDIVLGPNDSLPYEELYEFDGERPILNSKKVPPLNEIRFKRQDPSALGLPSPLGFADAKDGKFDPTDGTEVGDQGAADNRQRRRVGAHTTISVIGNHERAFSSLDDIVNSFKGAVEESTGIPHERVKVGRMNQIAQP
eukprot:GHVN01105684.1.p1 GENE.GHVN01105684.1~~GHVN01105684.1.p1  ORF type:complete len:327 (+),score=40.47 GHVN01105684.1:72-1052(+)